MLKFLLGTATGALLAFVFVRFNLEPPAILDVPEKVKKNVVATVIEGDLYDLAGDDGTHARALEVYFKTRAGDAAKIDAEAGHPFLKALYRARASREASLLLAQSAAFEKALDQPALRRALEDKHGVTEPNDLKRAMFWEALARKPFLKTWLEQSDDETSIDTVQQQLESLAQPPEAQAPPDP